MMKALLIVSALNGGLGTYEVEMPYMNECREASIAIIEQDNRTIALCVPAVAETAKMEKFFSIFMGIVTQMRELENERLDSETHR